MFQYLILLLYFSNQDSFFKMAIISNYINIQSNIKNIDRMFLSSIFVRLNLIPDLLKMRCRDYYICLLIAICFNSLIIMNMLFIQKTIKLVRTIECFHVMVLYKNLESLKHDEQILYMEISITALFLITLLVSSSSSYLTS